MNVLNLWYDSLQGKYELWAISGSSYVEAMMEVYKQRFNCVQLFHEWGCLRSKQQLMPRLHTEPSEPSKESFWLKLEHQSRSEEIRDQRRSGHWIYRRVHISHWCPLGKASTPFSASPAMGFC